MKSRGHDESKQIENKMREKIALGKSPVRRVFKRKTVTVNVIAHPSLRVVTHQLKTGDLVIVLL